jgi:hypothetical protein
MGHVLLEETPNRKGQRTRRAREGMARDELHYTMLTITKRCGIVAATTAMRTFPLDEFESKHLSRANVAPPRHRAAARSESSPE